MSMGTPNGELGPIVGLGALEQTIRDVLAQPQILGVYIDEALRQTYDINARTLRPKDIVCASDDDGSQLNYPAIMVQAEGDGDVTRHADRTYSVQYVVGIHCIVVGGSRGDRRRTVDVITAAARTMLLQRLLGKRVGTATIARVEWDGDAIDDDAPQGADAWAEMVAQLSVTVSGVASDRPGRIPGLPPNEPGTGGPAPGPNLPPVLTEFAVDLDGEDTTEWEPDGPEETP